jgi:hypothetical protein
MLEDMSSTSSRFFSPEMTYWSEVSATAWLPASMRGGHQLGHVGAQLAQFLVHAAADLAEVQAGEVLVEVVGGADQFRGRVGCAG